MPLALQHTTPLPGATSTADVPASITDRVCDVCLTKLSISNQHASYFNTQGITPEIKIRISEKQKKLHVFLKCRRSHQQEHGQSPVLYLFPNIKVTSSCNILMFCLLFILLIYSLLTKYYLIYDYF